MTTKENRSYPLAAVNELSQNSPFSRFWQPEDEQTQTGYD